MIEFFSITCLILAVIYAWVSYEESKSSRVLDSTFFGVVCGLLAINGLAGLTAGQTYPVIQMMAIAILGVVYSFKVAEAEESGVKWFYTVIVAACAFVVVCEAWRLC